MHNCNELREQEADGIVTNFLFISIGTLIRTIPNDPIRDLLISVHLMQDPNTLPVVKSEPEKYNQAIDQVRDNHCTLPTSVVAAPSPSCARKRLVSKPPICSLWCPHRLQPAVFLLPKVSSTNSQRPTLS